MVSLPAAPDPTLQAVDAALEERARRDKQRPYLGMSAIGQPCARKLWYGFRWSKAPEFDAATLKRFEDGHRGEDMQAERLRLVPSIDLATIDPTTGQQFAYVDHGGHFRGHSDGIISGLVQAPRKPHIWEHKQTDDKKQAKLEKLKAELGEKAALAKWDETYHAQAILYMAYSGLERHYLTCASAGGRRTVSVRTEADNDEAARLRQKALDIIRAEEPPPRLSEKPEYYICKWCEFSDICHGEELPGPNCRTCCHATPELDGDGKWTCAHYESQEIPVDFQRQGCDQHVYIPALVSYAEAVDSIPDDNYVVYKTADARMFTNGSKPEYDPDKVEYVHYPSKELHALEPSLVGNEFIERVREHFGATIAKGVS